MILAGAQDVGPVRYLLALQDFLEQPVSWIASSLTAPILGEQGQSFSFSWENAHPKLVITGTSLGDSLDKALVRWAIAQGIPCISVIEHWSWYRERFEHERELILPDWIIINDEVAMEEAVAEDLPKSRLFAGGNPWLEKLAFSSTAALDREAWRAQNQLPSGHLVLFVSEALKDSFPPGSETWLGYDEYTVLDALLSALPPASRLVIKRHPEESPSKYWDFVVSGHAYAIGKVSVEELAQGVDAAVGMGSMLLLELALFRNDVISFRPGARFPFIGEKIGATTAASDTSELAQLLRTPPSVIHALRTRFQGSGARIAHFLNSLIR